MARRATKTAPVWKGKPASKPRAKTGKPADLVSAPAKPETPALPVDVDSCVFAIEAICDEIDALLAKPRGHRMSLTYGYSGDYYSRKEPLGELRKKLRPLFDILTNLLNPPAKAADVAEPADDPEEVEEEVERKHQDPKEFMIRRLLKEPGRVPSWSRPGQFVVWFGFIPVRCDWPGVFRDYAWLVACDPRLLWINGGLALDCEQGIMPEHKTPEDVLRDGLREKGAATSYGRGAQKPTPSMRLHHMTTEQAGTVRAFLEASPWLQDALRAGPVNPVPMPDHLLLAQPPLM